MAMMVSGKAISAPKRIKRCSSMVLRRSRKTSKAITLTTAKKTDVREKHRHHTEWPKYAEIQACAHCAAQPFFPGRGKALWGPGNLDNQAS